MSLVAFAVNYGRIELSKRNSSVSVLPRRSLRPN